MEETRTVFTLSATFGFLLLILQQTSTAAQCSVASTEVYFRENNTENALVTVITVEDNVVLRFRPPPYNPDNPFVLDGNQLIAQRALDAEFPLNFFVIVTNINDNPPVYAPSYSANISERDFTLRSQSVPEILVNARLDYDSVKNVQLVLTAHDAPLEDGDRSYTATTTININILDGDNRPPWFLPCTEHSFGQNKVCVNGGYTGSVFLDEQETEPLELTPGPLFAIDGDSGINEEIRYSFLGGNGGGLFEINPTTGNITMLRVADVANNISLTVLATQVTNSDQAATTTVSISIHVRSEHPPRFERPLYEGIITSVGSTVLDKADMSNSLRIVATDEDYQAAGGINPHITYTITGSSGFTIFNNFLYMTGNIPDTTLTLQVTATDTTTSESDRSEIRVEVKAGITSTARPPSTSSQTPNKTPSGTTTKTPSVTPSLKPSQTTTKTPSQTSNTGVSTSTATGGTTSPGTITSSGPSTGSGSDSTGGSGQPATGGYSASDMAALGATLGALLLICLLVIGLLVWKMRRGKANSKKIFEASVFVSSVSESDGLKDGVQYTNQAFQHDDDDDRRDSGHSGKTLTLAPPEPAKPSWSDPSRDAVLRASLHDLLPDNASDAGSDKMDGEKEVKPILTKERRQEEGYKSVWFKEDIDPNAKEEVVIIPDSREPESDYEDHDDDVDHSDHDDDDDDHEGHDDDEDHEGQRKTPKVMFADSDLDSGLGVKMEDPAEDSDSDIDQNIFL
ncbi:cadherin-related family member 5-like [Salarias fasciatus]|uniref:cadherin-related family member 5-like n=1 Tax=Salarias fasciatus TaxID=181472 RepID=UPI001176D24C|nr:cadherin-related family member 5-like [Salarias fasciatus]